MDKTKPTVYQVTNRILYQLTGLLGTPSGKALLANLRNSIGKSLTETVEIWPIVFENLPEEFLGNSKKETAEEKTILNTLQLFALYQQGNSESVIAEDDEKYWENLGSSLATLRGGDDELATDRRFNMMITSTTYEELFYHLRQMISLLKSRSKGLVKINFAKLSEDLFLFMIGYEDRIRISWGREYYKNRKQTEEKVKELKNE